jgi:hypothetical protein
MAQPGAAAGTETRGERYKWERGRREKVVPGGSSRPEELNEDQVLGGR